MKPITTALALLLAAMAPAMAADAPQPAGTVAGVVHKDDDAGDSRVEQLNQQQLDSVRAQNGTTQDATTQPPGFLGAPLMRQSVNSTRLDE